MANESAVTPPEEADLVEQARTGRAGAFDKLVLIYRSRLRNVLRRMVGHPDDTDDLYQETLLAASQAIASFKGEAGFGTWLCAIGINLARDFLRRQKTWRTRAQVIYGNTCHDNDAWGREVYAAISDPAFQYDVEEHIAYCWSCVARTLPPEQNAALVYREFMGLTNRESAKQMGLSESVFRHHLAAARAHMRDSFDDLCVLVSKEGVCYQCAGLREGCAPQQRGAPAPATLPMAERIRIVSDADLDDGRSQAMHDLFYRRTAELEQAQAGDADAASKCHEHS